MSTAMKIEYYIRIVVFEIIRRTKLKFRYPLESVSELLTLLGLTLIMYFARSSLQIQGIELTYYICMLFALPSLQGPFKLISCNDEGNTTEHLFVLPIKVWGLAILKDISIHLISLPKFILFLLFSKYVLGFSEIGTRMVVNMLVLRIGSLGMGFIFAGLAVRFKRIGSTINVFSMAILALTFASGSIKLKWLDVLSNFNLYNAGFKYAMGNDNFIHILILASIYLAIGIIVYNIYEHSARKMGTLGRN